MLCLKDIVVHYGKVEALKGVSIDVEDGRVTTLIGANGAGKSTVLKAVSGMVRITKGEIWSDGRRIDTMPVEKIVRLGIAHVPEGKRLFLGLTVMQNLMSGAFLRKDKSGIQDDLRRTFEYFPILEKRRNQKAGSLSGGEQQMLAFGRALLSRPRVFLFDEPSLGLSPKMVEIIAESIRQLSLEGYTIVLVEQNASLALSLAERAYVLETGRVPLEGNGSELQTNEHVKRAYLGL